MKFWQPFAVFRHVAAACQIIITKKRCNFNAKALQRHFTTLVPICAAKNQDEIIATNMANVIYMGFVAQTPRQQVILRHE